MMFITLLSAIGTRHGVTRAWLVRPAVKPLQYSVDRGQLTHER